MDWDSCIVCGKKTGSTNAKCIPCVREEYDRRQHRNIYEKAMQDKWEDHYSAVRSDPTREMLDEILRLRKDVINVSDGLALLRVQMNQLMALMSQALEMKDVVPSLKKMVEDLS